MRIHFSEIALDELEDIKAWIARDSQHFANLFIEKIFSPIPINQLIGVIILIRRSFLTLDILIWK